MVTIQDFKDYARLDYDDPAAQPCLDAAVYYAKLGGVPPKSNNPLYDLFIKGVALYFYENRGFSPSMAVNSFVQDSWVTKQITSLKIMLEYGGAVEENEGIDDTGGCASSVRVI